MNWSKKHLKKYRKLVEEAYKNANVEQISTIISISTSKKSKFYYERIEIKNRYSSMYFSNLPFGGNNA